MRTPCLLVKDSTIEIDSLGGGVVVLELKRGGVTVGDILLDKQSAFNVAKALVGEARMSEIETGGGSCISCKLLAARDRRIAELEAKEATP